MKNVFLLSSSFSGSTMLSLILSSSEEIVTYGDTYAMNYYSNAEYKCSCGKKVIDCLEWNRHFNENETWLNLEPFPFSKIPFSKSALSFLYFQVFEYAPSVVFKNFHIRNEKFIHTALDFNPDGIYLDGSKYLQRVLLQLNRDQNFKVIHLVRDPYSYVYSNLKRNERSKNYKMQLFRWIAYNKKAYKLKSKISDRYKMVKYQNLIESPEKTIGELEEFLNINQIDFNTITNQGKHLIGNSIRHKWDGFKDYRNSWNGKLDPKITKYIKHKVSNLKFLIE